MSVYNDAASTSDAALYLVPTRDGRGKKLVRRPHPPPTATVLPDDFDAFTETRGSPTVLSRPHGLDGSELDLDYDDLTVAPANIMDVPPSPTELARDQRRAQQIQMQQQRQEQSRQMLSPRKPKSQAQLESPRSRRHASPPRSLDQLGFGYGADRAMSLLGSENKLKKPVITRAPSVKDKGKGKLPAANHNLVQRKVLEDGPERTISIWREDVAMSSGAGGSVDEEVPDLVDRREARRRAGSVSGNQEGVTQASMSGRHRDRLLRKSIDMGGAQSQSSRSSLNRTHSNSNASSPPGTQTTGQTSAPSLSQPQSPRRPGTSTSTTRPSDAGGPAPSLERILASCDPPLVHLGPVLASLGVRRDEHLRALGRMRAETRDREVREDALKQGVTVVEWAILIDRLQKL
ncbi:hypothetical protein PENSPDRAFT_658055 [Peniophora sp. CONT]|nr:hypothetical protein PENSPDRAFT_658055 [Peniophora sp. CONT]